MQVFDQQSTLFEVITKAISSKTPIFLTKFIFDNLPHIIPDNSAAPNSTIFPPGAINLKSFLKVEPPLRLKLTSTDFVPKTSSMIVSFLLNQHRIHLMKPHESKQCNQLAHCHFIKT
jgi:hypothetical protein